ncbi:MAG TPA: hypothetical protein VFE51_23340 [Verrucomicrobiae bacterium]|nr:hypothetical protein [Verrucomicrobiae bacterium]
MIKKKRLSLEAGLLLLFGCALEHPVVAQIPGMISHQGKITVDNTNFTGTGQFKFALVDAAGVNTFWSHDGTSISGTEPTGSPVSLPVTRGIFSVNLGDSAISNMSRAIPASVFTNGDVRLRVWFNDGIAGMPHARETRA